MPGRVTNLAYLPGNCYRCGGTPQIREWFMDLEYNEDYFGHLYLCNECVTTWVTECGFLSEEEYERRSERLLKENQELRNKVDDLELVYSNLAECGINLSTLAYCLRDFLDVKVHDRLASEFPDSDEGDASRESGNDERIDEQDSSGESGSISAIKPSDLKLDF